ncbi:MAG: GNAT family N-acetyltransferase [Nevskiales bacterium]|nr:GNAT family N-acetyltransferase [Nevskiales bacterium]
MSIRHLEVLFRPSGIVVVGEPQDLPAQTLIEHLDTLPVERRCMLHGERDGWECVKRPSQVSDSQLAVVLDPALVNPSLIRRLADRGCRALLWMSDEPVPSTVLMAGRKYTMRVLGPKTSGVTHAHGLGASSWALPGAGTTALIAQSRSIAGAALDWAAGHALGFSWVAVTGAEADVDVGDLLDYAALDPGTRAVVLQLSRVPSARKFMSAARACARSKPVVVLQTPSRDGGPQDPVLSAAFKRAGLVEVDRVTALFSSLAALDRVGEAATGRIAVIGTGSGICQLARASLLREGLIPSAPGDGTADRISQEVPGARLSADMIDLGLADDDATVAALKVALGTSEVDTVLFVRSPTPGFDDRDLARKIVASGLRERLVVVFLGQARAAPAVRICAEARIASFNSVEAAARALRYRREHRHTQELLMQTPTLDPIVHSGGKPPELTPPKHGGPRLLMAEEAKDLLAAYGLEPAAWMGAEGRGLRVRLRRHPELGMVMETRLDPASAAAPTVHALPPVDDVLAEIKLREAGLGARNEAPPGLRVRDYATAYARLAQLAVEQPLLSDVDIRLVPSDGIAEVGSARIQIDSVALPERDRLAMAPYPAELTHGATLRNGRPYRIRVIHPTDEPALIRMLTLLDPEEIRLRFFRYIRQFTHAMAARMTQIDYDREMTFVAVPEDDDDTVMGLSTLVFDPDMQEAEFAVLIHHDYVGQRLGRQLMEDILDYAAARKAASVYGDVLLENNNMLGLAQRLGFVRQRHPDDPGCVRVVIHPKPTRHLPPWLTTRSFAAT